MKNYNDSMFNFYIYTSIFVKSSANNFIIVILVDESAITIFIYYIIRDKLTKRVVIWMTDI